MAFLDFLLSKEMKRRKAANAIGVESGLFVVCPVCHGVTEAENSSALIAATEALIDKLRGESDPRLALFDRDAKAAMETVRQVGKDLPFRCLCHHI